MPVLADTPTVKVLAARIVTLERRIVVRQPALCPQCGDPMDLSLPVIVKPEYVVVFGDEPDDGPECCPGCGRRRVYRIEFDKGG